ncbi:MAG: hypothetical protein Q7T96_17280 [Methylobacter sp.]|uniref:hypothetical protein n=1 Tax=Methylobacter sp. TaxID=2051955 RepID=UPI00271727F3|nr:hypothetical protein [Methylobacter sp.]MDO9270858.1 hypothetical protein [Methylobacter sp.]MDP1664646.1 hypothetical protein [Methylobacter sp.]MDP1970311.1 hypothetical protein [Methylobacter sp.]
MGIHLVSSAMEITVFAISPITILLFIASFGCVVNIVLIDLPVSTLQLRLDLFTQGIYPWKSSWIRQKKTSPNGMLNAFRLVDAFANMVRH